MFNIFLMTLLKIFAIIVYGTMWFVEFLLIDTWWFWYKRDKKEKIDNEETETD